MQLNDLVSLKYGGSNRNLFIFGFCCAVGGKTDLMHKFQHIFVTFPQSVNTMQIFLGSFMSSILSHSRQKILQMPPLSSYVYQSQFRPAETHLDTRRHQTFRLSHLPLCLSLKEQSAGIILITKIANNVEHAHILNFIFNAVELFNSVCLSLCHSLLPSGHLSFTCPSIHTSPFSPSPGPHVKTLHRETLLMLRVWQGVQV